MFKITGLISTVVEEVGGHGEHVAEHKPIMGAKRQSED